MNIFRMLLLFTVSYFENDVICRCEQATNYIIILKIGDCERKEHSDYVESSMCTLPSLYPPDISCRQWTHFVLRIR